MLQVQIYTWPDATLRELTDLVKEVQPAARRTTARLEFALIYPDKKGRNVMRVIGGAHSSRPGPDDIKTLKQLNFQVCGATSLKSLLLAPARSLSLSHKFLLIPRQEGAHCDACDWRRALTAAGAGRHQDPEAAQFPGGQLSSLYTVHC